jgi:hypothetical protein
VTRERWAQIGISIEFLIVVRTLAEFFRLKHLYGENFSTVAAAPYIGGALIAACTCWAGVVLYFSRRYALSAWVTLAATRALAKRIAGCALANRDMLFRPRYGLMGCIMLPYLWVFELVEPIIEMLGYVSIAIGAWLGLVNQQFFFEFILFGYAFATMISIGGVLLEELTLRRYTQWRDVARMIIWCFMEHFPYRQLHMVWRLQGIWQFLRRRHDMARDATQRNPERNAGGRFAGRVTILTGVLESPHL